LNGKVVELNAGLWSPVRRLVLCDHSGEETPTHIPARGQTHEARAAGTHQVIENRVGHGFVKGTLVAVRPHIQFERLELDILLVGNVVDGEVSKVWLARKGTEAGELGDLNVDLIVTVWLRVGESLKFAGGLCGHIQGSFRKLSEVDAFKLEKVASSGQKASGFALLLYLSLIKEPVRCASHSASPLWF
jgi:hypothetical protein